MRFAPLGGCGEFGLHSTLFQVGNEALCVDAGLLFPDDDTPGVDHLVPDFGALDGAGVSAYLITHAHEDHIGALGWALEHARAPGWRPAGSETAPTCASSMAVRFASAPLS